MRLSNLPNLVKLNIIFASPCFHMHCLDYKLKANFTSNEEFHSSCSFDLFFKSVTFRDKIRSVPVKDVCVCRVDVDVLEEVSPHEGVITLWVISLQGCKNTRELVNMKEW